MTKLLECAFEKVQFLPANEQDRLARLLLEEVESQEKDRASLREPRTPGLGKGMIEMTDDFNNPLPDSFWLGEE